MEVIIKQVTSWSDVLDASRWTVAKEELNKEPSNKFKKGILMAQHSPIRLLEFDIKLKGIPYRNAVHFVRHHIGCEKFQCTLRDDRNNDITNSYKLPQGQPVNLWIRANAESIINISQKRLCNLAESNTRNIWEIVKEEMKNVDPIVASFMVKTCIYRGFCPEMNSCKWSNTISFETQLNDYRNLINYEKA